MYICPSRGRMHNTRDVSRNAPVCGSADIKIAFLKLSEETEKIKTRQCVFRIAPLYCNNLMLSVPLEMNDRLPFTTIFVEVSKNLARSGKNFVEFL